MDRADRLFDGEKGEKGVSRTRAEWSKATIRVASEGVGFGVVESVCKERAFVLVMDRFRVFSEKVPFRHFFFLKPSRLFYCTKRRFSWVGRFMFACASVARGLCYEFLMLRAPSKARTKSVRLNEWMVLRPTR